MNQLSSNYLAGDKPRHTVKEPTDLEAELVTEQGNVTGTSEFLSYLVQLWIKISGSSSLAAPELKLKVNLIGSRISVTMVPATWVMKR